MWNSEGQPASFYHRSTERMIKAIMDVFNDITIPRVKEGIVTDYVVPLRFATMNAMIVKYNETENSAPIATVYPRMGISIDDMDILKSNTNQNLTHVRAAAGSSYATMLSGVEVRITLTLSIVANKISELFNIIEQIIPRFRKKINIPTIEPLGIKRDCALKLIEKIKFDYSSEFNYGEDRVTTNEIKFTCDFYVYPPINDQGVIKHIDIDFYDQTTELIMAEDNWDVIPEEAGKLDPHVQQLTMTDDNGDPVIVISEEMNQ